MDNKIEKKGNKKKLRFIDRIKQLRGDPLFHTKLKLFAAMVAGGVIMGLPAGVISHFLTKTFIRKIDLQRDKRSDKKELL